VKAALGAEAPLGGRWSGLASAGYVHWTAAQDLIAGSPAFFPRGSAAALEVEAGAAVQLHGALGVRAVVEYSRTTYAFELDPSPTYVATGAVDEYLGLRVMMRGAW